MIQYYSTNKKSELVNFREALLAGQASDKGLYMPNYIRRLPLSQISSMKDLFYWETAFIVTKEFLRDEILENELERITKEAYNFEIPLENVFGRVYIYAIRPRADCFF